MTKAIEFYFDFGSPTTYLAYHRLKQLNKKYGVEILCKPVLLGGIFKGANNNSPAFVPLKAQWMDIDMNRYASRFGIELKQNPFFPINTLYLMRGVLVAEELGCLDRYIETVFNAMWREPKNLGDLAILIETLTEAELDAEKILQGAQQEEIKQDLKQRTSDGLARGLFGCPTLFYGDEFFFGQDRIFFIEEMIKAEASDQN